MAKLNREDFVLTGMDTLRTGKQKGLRLSKPFAEAFTEYFGPRAQLSATIAKLGRDGKLVAISHGENGKSHITLYKAGEQPKPKATAAQVLATMGIKVRKVRKVQPAHVDN